MSFRALEARVGRWAAPIFAFALLVGCGGGSDGEPRATKPQGTGGSDGTGTPPTPPTQPPTEPPTQPPTEPPTQPPTEPPTQPPTDDFRAAVAAMPKGTWLKANVNDFSAAWVPEALRPNMAGGNPTPDAIIKAWSSFAWDSKRSNLMLFGGGHANYRGNEMYIWEGSTRKWTRGSLPSAMVEVIPGSLVFNAIDGARNAPASAHTYDNSLYLPIVDRFITFGGAADNTGGWYETFDTNLGKRRPTGPYLFDPNRADPDKVGGTTGSNVKRVPPYLEIIGGNMWSNREAFLFHGFSASHVEGCTGYATENDKDVVYVHIWLTGVFRYTLNEIDKPENDTWEKVGLYWGGPGNQGSCAYDSFRKALVRTGNNVVPIVYFDMNTPGPGNTDVLVKPTDPTGEFDILLNTRQIDMEQCGLDFDSRRRRFELWCGGDRVWSIEPPTPLSANGWSLSKRSASGGSAPTGDIGTGVLGKWKYAPDLDVFVALQDPVKGNVWIYKPAD